MRVILCIHNWADTIQESYIYRVILCAYSLHFPIDDG